MVSMYQISITLSKLRRKEYNFLRETMNLVGSFILVEVMTFNIIIEPYSHRNRIFHYRCGGISILLV